MEALSKHPEVVCTELEDGAVLLNLETRFYYSLDRVGLDIWNLIDSVDNGQELADRLMQGYEAAGEDAQELVAAFLERLQSESLIVASEGEVHESSSSHSPLPAGQPEGRRMPLTAPILSKHDEPLHEVPLHPFDPQLPLAE